MRHSLVNLFCLAVLAAPALSQERIDITPAQARAAAVELLNLGNADQASEIAGALLERDNEDITALLISARASEQRGQASETVRFARRAYRVSSGGSVSYTAARLTANALAAQGLDSRAQLWLRRAYQFAPDEAAKQSVGDDYQVLRSRNPWSNNLSFGVAPESNINGAANNSEPVAFFSGIPIPPEPVLSGTRYSGSASTSYRLESTATSATFATAALNFNLYTLSSTAQERNPDAEGNDFSSGSLSFGLKQRAILAEGQLPTDFSLTFSQNWSEGVKDNVSVDANISHVWRVSDVDSISFFARQLRRSFEDETDAAAKTSSASVGWTRQISEDRLRLTYDFTRSLSEQSTYDYDTNAIRASYDFGNSFNGLLLGFDLEFTETDYNQLIGIVDIERVDRSRAATVRIVNENIEFYGFQPIAKLQLRQIDSTFSLYDRDFANLSFDLRSSF